MNIRAPMRRFAGALAVLVCAALLAPFAQADKVTLRDGKVIEGEIIRELDGSVWIKSLVSGVEQTQFYSSTQVLSIERDTEGAAEPPPAERPRAATDRKADPQKRDFTGANRAAVISLGEGGDKNMVGLYMTADSLRNCIPLLEAEGVDTVVLRINSGGGALLEIQRLSDVIHEELKPKFRVVTWIEYAISAAAMTAHCVEEHYFMSRGSYGACTGWFGALQAVKGRELEEVVYMMEKISARGGYDPQIMLAMQVTDDLREGGAPLSYDKDPATGNVTFYQNTEGEHVLNTEDRILTFTSKTAEACGFSKGTADTLDQLAEAMGLTEVVWVGEWVDGVDYPVCRAEQYMRDFRDRTARDAANLGQYFTTYQQAIAIAQATPREDRGAFVGRARRELNKIVKMVDNNPNMALFQLGMYPEDFPEWVEQQEKLLRDLMR
ncbi:MAG: hypothetical protein ACF8R7_01115 [Phycisphaerales bacterium JB039]